MTRPKTDLRKPRRRPFSIALLNADAPRVQFTDEQWNTIAGDYCALTEEDKAKIAEVLSTFLHFQQGERAAEPVESSALHLKRITSGAKLLFDSLRRPEPPKQFTYAQQAAIDEVLRHLNSSLEIYFHRPVDLSHNDAVSVAGFLLTACENAMTHLREQSGPGIRIHDAWRQFAWRLMDWAESRVPPLKVSISKKTELSRNWPSPFVKFVHRLTMELPSENREFANPTSENSLTDALDDVRLQRRVFREKMIPRS